MVLPELKPFDWNGLDKRLIFFLEADPIGCHLHELLERRFQMGSSADSLGISLKMLKNRKGNECHISVKTARGKADASDESFQLCKTLFVEQNATELVVLDLINSEKTKVLCEVWLSRLSEGSHIVLLPGQV